MPQPDVALLIDPNKGGQATLNDDGYVEGAPELIVEVAASTSSIDLNTKLRVYRRNNVKEYVVWRVLDAAVDWFVLDGGEYRRLAPGEDGMIRSQSFPGLWMDPAALVAVNYSRILEVVQLGLASPEHEAFVARLRAMP